MQAADGKAYSFAGFTVDLRQARLRTGEREIELRPKSFALLCYLVENAGRLVPKDELVQAIWPNVFVTDDSLTRCVSDVRLALNDGERRIIKTVLGRGYLFAVPVSRIEPPVVVPLRDRGSEGVALHPPQDRRWRNTAVVMSATLALASVIIGAGAFSRLRPPVVAACQAGVSTTASDIAPSAALATVVPPSAALTKLATQTAPRISIVVLPFTNLSGDAALEYYADGFTENLTTDLSRIGGSFVIAHTTASTYKGKALSAQEIAKELKVRYVLEGGVQNTGNHLRVNAQLIDGETGSYLWAERYDRDSTDLLQIQDEIAKQIANALGNRLVAAESERSWRDHPTDPDSLDYTLRAAATSLGTANSNACAQRLYERAVELDPQNVDALIGLARTYETEVEETWVTGSAGREALKNANDAVTRALSIDPRSASAYSLKSRILAYMTQDDYRGEIVQAIEAGEIALEINSNQPNTLIWLGRLYSKGGHPERTPPLIEQAIHLNPANVGAYQYTIGMAQLQMGHYDEAIDSFQRLVLLRPNSVNGWGGLTGAFIAAGRDIEAQRALSKWREVSASQSGYELDYSTDKDVLSVRVQLALLRLGRWPYSTELWIEELRPRAQLLSRALLKFQADENLPQTGQPDEATLARLGISSQVTEASSK
jgi:TolB-like protein/DNA-binding winged helix-turn-helix (wHTH) protein/Tfp pilus assembly protein PilF